MDYFEFTRQEGKQLKKTAKEEATIFLDYAQRAGDNIRQEERRRLEKDRQEGRIDLSTPDDDLEFFSEKAGSHNQAMTVSCPD